MTSLRMLSLLLMVIAATAVPVPAQEASGRFDAVSPARAERTGSPVAVVSTSGPADPQAVTGDTLFNNGPLVTHAGNAGAPDTSRLNTGENILGFGHAISGGNRIADDFTVSGGDWQIDSVKFFAYQTNSGLTSTINALNLRIWDGPPGQPGSNVVWGDPTTNRLSSTRWSRIYRTGTPFSAARPVMLVVVNVNTLLPGGTYWLDWQAGGSASFSGPWVAPVTLRGDTAAGNAVQYAAASGWTPALDDGNPPYPSPVQKAIPFIIEGSVVPYVKDIRVASVSLSPPFPPLGAPVTVSATIENLGTEANPAALPLTYKVGSAPGSLSDGTQEDFTPSWTGSTANVTFATTFNAATPRDFSVYVRSFYTGDQDGSNDVGVGTEYALPDTDLVLEAFGQINGIPVPFGPSRAFPADIPREQLKAGAGIPASEISRTALLAPPADRSAPELALRRISDPFDKDPLPLRATEGIGAIEMQTWVRNFGSTAPPFSVDWEVGGASQPPVARPGVASLAVDTVTMTGVPAQRGTLTATTNVVVPGDPYPGDNTGTFERTLVYPSPNVRLRYDDGSLTVNTNIGFGGGTALTAGVRFTATQSMTLANIDAIYSTEGSTDSVLVQIRAAGPNDSTAGPVLYSMKFGGPNYITAGNDYFTLPLGADAPVIASGSSFWVAITFADTNVAFPMAAQNIPPATAGRSFFSGNGGASWSRLRVGSPATERAWMMRVVGIPYSTITVQHVDGWNMLSNPVDTEEDSVRQLYPFAVFPHGFSFAGLAGYVQQFLMARGLGFWVKMPNGPLPTTIGGAPVPADSIPVIAGWNLVGSISDTVDTATVTSVPPGIRASDFFAYPYAPAPQILPGQGYWVKALSPGKLYFSAARAAAPPPQSNAAPFEQLSSLTVTDAAGRAQTLYFGADPLGIHPASRYALPPLPPDGAFDVRFSSADGGAFLRTHPSEPAGAADMTVEVRGALAPVTLRWTIAGGWMYELTDAAGGLRTALTSDGEIVLASAPERLAIRPAGGATLPEAFALEQNYPNPFNPVTTLRYQLPQEARVTLKVYDLLGREVAVLVDEVQKPGYRAAEWNAAGAASGVYFYRLDAGTFSQVRRMVVLK